MKEKTIQKEEMITMLKKGLQENEDFFLLIYKKKVVIITLNYRGDAYGCNKQKNY